MDHFDLRDGVLHCELVPLTEVAEAVGTPAYVYSRATLTRHYHAFANALEGIPHQVCFAVKANSSLAVLNVLARLGAGFDIVSGGELERVLRAGGEPGKVVFSGVGKTAGEMRRALQVGIHCFNVESGPELELLNAVAGDMGLRAPIAIRVNPDVDAETHPYIATGLRENKFGVDIAAAHALYLEATRLGHLEIRGVGFHIGSQLTRLTPFTDALRRVLALADDLERDGIGLAHIDVGGGLGVRYRDETPPEPADYAAALRELLADRNWPVLLEPGRAIAANAGVFLTRVELLKHTAHKDFAVVDGAMNDLIRPALYGAWQEIVPVSPRNGESRRYDVVGPVCETGDFLGRERELVLAPGDLMAVRSAGAYGYVMASNYNSRPRPPEVMVDGDRYYIVNRREQVDHLMMRESMLPVAD
ncbi:Diaminopimelate decarboxylase [Thioalkalivibrio nitratireducens DSM 14787]|uniref:Diaminopimelate decarboxylase n=1 Tax=Thioalkalivibrio nitratireducens (strain DSM 14787 / UNIQEM 213 / ALEN2) TaxID=1255043 RepID=L0DS26_THIND|nr:diaminopimelate decarboxylase [Thioalkalivibrio nitratireducens]AGA31792.1 Diaminopimelate decarboxylase [Thioalkalivibrio nitratireducens DSM 14787]